jgi:predicted PurR-regulated permease PerM
MSDQPETKDVTVGAVLDRLRIENRRLREIILQSILVIGGVVLALWLLYMLKTVLLLLAFTVIFCYLIAPLVELVERFLQFGTNRSPPRGAAVLLVYFVVLIVCFFSFELLLPRLSDQIDSLVANAPVYTKQVDEYKNWLLNLPARYRLPRAWREMTTNGINSVIAVGTEWLKGLALGLVEYSLYLPWLILIPILGFFFMKDIKIFRYRIITTLPEAGQRYRAAVFMKDVSETLAAYIRAQLIACLTVGLIVWIGLWLLGAPYSMVLGVTAALLEFIPVIGPATLLLIAVLVASLTSWNLALLVLAFLGLHRLIHDYVIYPRLVSRGIELHPVAIILAVLCGAELGGIAGIYLSVPVTALLTVSWRHYREQQEQNEAAAADESSNRAGADQNKGRVEGAAEEVAEGEPVAPASGD